MKAFGVVALMIVVAVITFVMGRQIGEMRRAADGGAATGATGANASVAASVKQIQDKAVTDTAKAADQAASRVDAADK